jgi:hypothetical protein
MKYARVRERRKTKLRHNFNDGKSLIFSAALKNMQNSHKK